MKKKIKASNQFVNEDMITYPPYILNYEPVKPQRLKDFFYLIYNQNGMEFSKEEIKLIISAVEQYYNIEREYKSQYKHNMEVTFPLLKKLEKLK